MINRTFVAQTGRIPIETMQQIDPQFKTPGLNALVESFRRVELNPQ
ncbi:hypothetical protein [Leptolyngbya sp. AN10]